MRQCTTCGRTYPNEVDECEYDGSPLFHIGDAVEDEPAEPPQGQRANIFGAPKPTAPTPEPAQPVTAASPFSAAQPMQPPQPSQPDPFGQAAPPSFASERSFGESPAPDFGAVPAQPTTPEPEKPAYATPASVFPDISSLEASANAAHSPTSPAGFGSESAGLDAPGLNATGLSATGVDLSGAGSSPSFGNNLRGSSISTPSPAPASSGPPSLGSIPNIPAAPTLTQSQPLSPAPTSQPAPAAPSTPPATPSTPGSSLPPMTPSSPGTSLPPLTPSSSGAGFPPSTGRPGTGAPLGGPPGAGPTGGPNLPPNRPQRPTGGPPKSRPVANAKSDAESLLAGIDQELGNFKDQDDDFPPMYDAPPVSSAPSPLLGSTGSQLPPRNSMAGSSNVSLQTAPQGGRPAARSFTHITPTDFPSIQQNNNFPESRPMEKESSTNFIMIGGLIVSIIGAAATLVYILFFANP